MQGTEQQKGMMCRRSQEEAQQRRKKNKKKLIHAHLRPEGKGSELACCFDTPCSHVCSNCSYRPIASKSGKGEGSEIDMEWIVGSIATVGFCAFLRSGAQSSREPRGFYWHEVSIEYIIL